MEVKVLANFYTAMYDWRFLNEAYLCGSDPFFTRLGTYNDSHINFFKVKYGRGTFIFHSNPIVFCNLFFVKAQGKEYMEKVFSYLPEGDIYWDELLGKFEFSKSGNSKSLSTSPFSYILSQTSLAWAFYISIMLSIIYVIFAGKRMQRIIPVLEPNSNTSLEFVQTIGSLSFLQKNLNQQVIQQMKLFLGHIRQRYKLATLVGQMTGGNKRRVKDGGGSGTREE